MIYDTFLYFNERDLVRLRMGYLNPIVDMFVVVESVRDFCGRPKEPSFSKVMEELPEEWRKKIRHVIIEDFSDLPKGKHRYYFHQKNGVLKGLEGAQPNDLILMSDIDEIPHRDSIPMSVDKPMALMVRRFFYWFNTPLVKAPDPLQDGRIVVCHKQDIEKDLMRLVSIRLNLPRVERPVGWHFSHLGCDSESLRKKMLASSHTEYHGDKFSSIEVLDKHRKQLTLPYGGHQLGVEKVDERYPDYLLDNIEQFSHLILEC